LSGGLLLAGGLAWWWLRPAPTQADGIAVSASNVVSAATRTTASTALSARPSMNGEWRADVTCDWPNAHYSERFVFGGEAGELQGSASFLGVARGIVEASAAPDGLRFVTRTKEASGGATADTVHRYRGRLQNDEIRFVMQTGGSDSPHVPVEFVVRRATPGGSTINR
jgi:hypothetical protein